jgi:CBS domain-containing protein
MYKYLYVLFCELMYTVANDFLRAYDVDMEIRDIAKEAVVIGEDATFRDAISLMITKQTNSLLVVDEEGRLAGKIGMSDLLSAIVPEYLDPEKILEEMSSEKGFAQAVENASEKEVREFMAVDVEPIHVDDTLLAIAGTAITHGTHYIPIVDHDNRPIGTISRRGLKHILAKYLNIKDVE